MILDKKHDIWIWELSAFAFVSILGTLLHFAYDFFGGNFAALFSGVNESTWEHMKLLFFPMLLAAVIGSFFLGKEYKNYWCTKLFGILIGLALIPVLFYTLGGIFGGTLDFVNIGIFFVSAAAAYLYETVSFKKNGAPRKYEGVAICILCTIALLFFVFTFVPPEIALFRDPVNGKYGI